MAGPSMEQGSRAVCSSDSEVDLLFLHQGRRLGFAVKFSEAPRLTASMRTLAWRFNADRMVMDYVRHCYLPAAVASSCQMPTP